MWTVFLRYLDVSLQYLTVSPRISLHLLASPRISQVELEQVRAQLLQLEDEVSALKAEPLNLRVT